MKTKIKRRLSILIGLVIMLSADIWLTGFWFVFTSVIGGCFFLLAVWIDESKPNEYANRRKRVRRKKIWRY